MALNITSKLAEMALGHDSDNTNNTVTTDVSNYGDKSESADKTETMKALAWWGKNDVRVIDTPKPKIIDDKDVILRVTGSTICGSDIHLLHGVILQLEKGDILGHEFCGIIDEVGPAVTNLRPGQRVVNSFSISCGKCRFCEKNLTTACENTNASSVHSALYGERMAGIFGYSHFVGGYAGGQAEYVRVPIGEQNLMVLPDSVPDEKGLFLSDVLATAYHAIQDTAVYEGDTVAIWGLGPIGMLTCMFAFRNGASRVIGIDNNWRTEYCKKKLPKLETINYATLERGQTVTSEIHKLVPGGVDVCIEAAGGEYAKGWAHYLEMAIGAENDTSELLNEAITSTRKFGRVGIIADYVGFTNHFNIGALMEKGIRLIGNGQAPVQKYWKELLQLVESGEIDPRIILTHRISLTDIAKGYYKFEKREEGLMKYYVETRFSPPPAEGTPALTEL